ncbi:extracellular solute-binding protein [Chelativorans sp. YIM 93263]|uniref:extracellular solute-binding protein n=1 Tax=Chelativorans sp. YIM 93263 TaxID=2906648 RepID=UPI0023781178|nr:extracellular solute-binding protein [Chelativorans sp. YIM 93263]
MTWSHPRGFDPMQACAKEWQAKTGVSIDWEKRSLQDFESFPVETLAREYDLIVIDHPHVGEITAQGCLAPLDVPGREAERAALEAASVGASYPSYEWEGRQWAFPIDAAAQVQAWRPDLIDSPAADWNEVMELAGRGMVLLPLRPPHSLMTFYSLAANTGRPCRNDGGGDFVDAPAGEEVLETMRAMAALIDRECLGMDPIAVLERMAEKDSPIACSPLIYGYVSYSVEGFRDRRVLFGDLPPAGTAGPVGSAIGGTGIAVSAFSSDREAAKDFAYWVASGAVQRGLYAQSGGQPGHGEAWEDDAVNAMTGDFYRATRETLEGGWLRPRHRGYMDFQQSASEVVNAVFAENEPAAAAVKRLNALFRESFEA